MRAKTVNENMDFERGKDPKSAINIRVKNILMNNIEKIFDPNVYYYGLNEISLTNEKFRIDSVFRKRIHPWNYILKDLGIRKYFKTKVEVGEHADGTLYDFIFKDEYKALFPKGFYWSKKYE